MNKESFESLKQYKPNKQIVNESLLLEKGNEEGVFGSIIDRGLTFIPRAARFKQAKKVMKKSLAGYTKKAKNVIDKFSKGLDKKVDKLESRFKDFKNDKLKVYIEEGKKQEAFRLAQEKLKELENYKAQQKKELEKSIDAVLKAYTSSIHHRIDHPGFILNVELSQKGKGELKAKWEELVAIQNSKLDHYKTSITETDAWKKIDDMIAELSGFLESKRNPKSADISFRVQHILKNEKTSDYNVKVHLRIDSGRIILEEKGIIYGKNQNKLKIGEEGVTIRVVKGSYELTASTYDINVNDADQNDYVRGYIIIKGRTEPLYTSNMFSFADAKTSKEFKQGEIFGGKDQKGSEHEEAASGFMDQEEEMI